MQCAGERQSDRARGAERVIGFELQQKRSLAKYSDTRLIKFVYNNNSNNDNVIYYFLWSDSRLKSIYIYKMICTIYYYNICMYNTILEAYLGWYGGQILPLKFFRYFIKLYIFFLKKLWMKYFSLYSQKNMLSYLFIIHVMCIIHYNYSGNTYIIIILCHSYCIS